MLNSATELTLFLPIDSAWSVLDPLERTYLESEFATDDLTRILNMHAVVEKDVRWSDSFGPSTNRQSYTVSYLVTTSEIPN
jgi:solute carrier family 25 carnitine/acylcarnitine transporter 20/29